MAKLPWIPFYPDDYLSSPSVSTCDLIEEAVYFRLLLFCWKHPGCQLPNDLKYLRRLCKNQVSEERISRVLDRHFVLVQVSGKPVDNPVENGKVIAFWRNLRLYSEFTKGLKTSQTNSIAAQTRWHKEGDKLLDKIETANATVVQPDMQVQSEGDASRYQNQTETTPKRKTRQVIALEKAHLAWKEFVDEVIHSAQNGGRIVITSKTNRDVMYAIGGVTRLRSEVDTVKYKEDFIVRYMELELESFKRKKGDE